MLSDVRDPPPPCPTLATFCHALPWQSFPTPPSGSIQGIVQWQNARRFFFWRLRRRLHEFHVIRQLQQADPQVTQQEGRAQLQAWAPAGLEDAAFVKWCEENEGSVADKVKAIWAVCVCVCVCVCVFYSCVHLSAS